MENTFLIGEISKLFQIDIRTLRYYDKIGLFKPQSVDSSSGYRRYTIDQFEQLNTIMYLKSLNVPLKNIKLFLENRDIDHILLLLEEQQQVTEQKLKEFNQIQKKLERRIRLITDAAGTIKLGAIQEIQLPERTIVLLKERIHKDHNLEMFIRLLENNANMKSAIFLGEVGLSISVKNLHALSFDEYSSLFIMVNQEKEPIKEAKVLSGGNYLSIRFQGTHKDAAPYYKRLMDYVSENGYTLEEDALEITLIDYGFTNDTSKFITEIQLLVKKN
ncbi:MerR family transcriptional regulator [Bacillus sp. 1P06AnD]|uniref:MerR family transcriptional regulator n=1 Tax=Bacillus sp. 1P06AnD TaxID=3132208 RepID=UPI0039A2B09D